ncbi:MAG TPA: hypothetical protein VIH89_00955 [Candidatus Sulfotelmatobacter sp.]|jgi:hypothetical protein
MKIFVMHDDSGKIKGTFATTQNNVEAKPTKGMRTHVVEQETLEGDELKKYLYELHNSFRVEIKSGGTSLVKK